MISPCIKVCKIALDANYCIGCFRTLEEIQDWSNLSDDKRQHIMHTLKTRKEKQLLREVVGWYEEDIGKGKLSGLMDEIKTHLERTDAENQDTTKSPKCPNPFCEGYSVQE